MAGQGVAVTAVVPLAADDENAGRGGLGDHLKGVSGESTGGILHENNRGNGKLLDRRLIHRPNGLAAQYITGIAIHEGSVLADRPPAGQGVSGVVLCSISMQNFMIIAWILMILSVGILVVWIAIGVRVQSMLADDLMVRKGLSLPEPAEGWPRLSIVIPAHNEQRVIEKCAESLRHLNYPDYEIIFVLDRCTDNTAKLLAPHAEADDRIVVIENDSCPRDWAGKCNAARLGAERATGKWLLFSDADTIFDPDLARASMALALQEKLGLLSLLTTLHCEHWFERVVQPVASMNLIQLYPPARADRSRRSRAFANGQFMLFDRAQYERIGGHVTVHKDLLEDIAIARHVFRDGGRIGVFFAGGMLTCSMYGSFAAFRDGWNRIYIEACKRKPTRLRKYGRQSIIVGVVAPLVQIAALGAALASWNYDRPFAIALACVVSVGWLVQLGTLMRIYPLSGAPRSASLAFPWGSWIVGRIMLRGAADLKAGRPIKWGGREYVLEVRE